ncbi:MAG: type II toxin-antitoxin system VapC family toxin [Candidatus Sabulitectum sp.]|nr:type II toxin-antitoxin system VapC family toxin [Candidatus Sabulitectum sp.]
MYVLDTNTLIYFFKGRGNVAEQLLGRSPEEISIPSVVLYELEVGIAKSTNPARRRQQLDSLVSQITILPFGVQEAGISAKIRATLEREGKPIGPYDTLIAGTALANLAILVTHNTAEFERVKGLVIEDWF